jgi:hypothetical protein
MRIRITTIQLKKKKHNVIIEKKVFFEFNKFMHDVVVAIVRDKTKKTRE